jgi:hypothetical protein
MPIRDATNLWIQAGAMSGGPRHQTEFSDELALFLTTTREAMNSSTYFCQIAASTYVRSPIVVMSIIGLKSGE